MVRVGGLVGCCGGVWGVRGASGFMGCGGTPGVDGGSGKGCVCACAANNPNAMVNAVSVLVVIRLTRPVKVGCMLVRRRGCSVGAGCSAGLGCSCGVGRTMSFMMQGLGFDDHVHIRGRSVLNRAGAVCWGTACPFCVATRTPLLLTSMKVWSVASRSKRDRRVLVAAWPTMCAIVTRSTSDHPC